MPILDDIMDHDVLGPVLRQGREEGRKEGSEETARRFIRRSLEHRFGTVPAWLDTRLASLSAQELESLFGRLPEVSNIRDLFPNSK